MGAAQMNQTHARNRIMVVNSTTLASGSRNTMRDITIGDNNIIRNPIFSFMDDDGVMIENDSDTDTDSNSDDDSDDIDDNTDNDNNNDTNSDDRKKKYNQLLKQINMLKHDHKKRKVDNKYTMVKSKLKKLQKS
eukprot:106915_1